MVCSKCGTVNPDGAAFCTKCGNRLEDESGPKLIKMQCTNCNAFMEVNKEEQEMFCPYCGAKQYIVDSDAVAIEKIKSNTAKELEYAKMADAKEKERKQEVKSYRKSKFGKFTIVFAIISVVLALVAFSNKHVLAGIVAILMIGLFATSWMMGMQMVKEKFKNMFYLLAIAGFVLVIPYFMASSQKKLEWPNTEITTHIPKPKAKHGEVIICNTDSLNVKVEKFSQEDFEKYVQKCKDVGYTIEEDYVSSTFEAFNPEGYKLYVSLSDATMRIDLDAPEKMEEIKWPDTDIVKLMPKPKSSTGKIKSNYEDAFVVEVGETPREEYESYVEVVKAAGFNLDKDGGKDSFYASNSDGYRMSVSYKGNSIISIEIEHKKEEVDETSNAESNVEQDSDDADISTSVEETTEKSVESEKETESTEETKPSKEDDKKDSGFVNPELKDFLDSYEAFMDEYIVFMEKFANTDDTTVLLMEYTEYMTKYADLSAKAEAYDEDTMSDADLMYYTEVMLRIEEKMIKASFQY